MAVDKAQTTCLPILPESDEDEDQEGGDDNKSGNGDDGSGAERETRSKKGDSNGRVRQREVLAHADQPASEAKSPQWDKAARITLNKRKVAAKVVAPT